MSNVTNLPDADYVAECRRKVDELRRRAIEMELDGRSSMARGQWFAAESLEIEAARIELGR